MRFLSSAATVFIFFAQLCIRNRNAYLVESLLGSYYSSGGSCFLKRFELSFCELCYWRVCRWYKNALFNTYLNTPSRFSVNSGLLLSELALQQVSFSHTGLPVYLRTGPCGAMEKRQSGPPTVTLNFACWSVKSSSCVHYPGVILRFYDDNSVSVNCQHWDVQR